MPLARLLLNHKILFEKSFKNLLTLGIHIHIIPRHSISDPKKNSYPSDGKNGKNRYILSRLKAFNIHKFSALRVCRNAHFFVP